MFVQRDAIIASSRSARSRSRGDIVRARARAYVCVRLCVVCLCVRACVRLSVGRRVRVACACRASVRALRPCTTIALFLALLAFPWHRPRIRGFARESLLRSSNVVARIAGSFPASFSVLRRATNEAVELVRAC